MHTGVVRQLLLASSRAKQSLSYTGSSSCQLQQRSLQLAVLRNNDMSSGQSMPLRALLVDAAGTLISPSEPVAEVTQPTLSSMQSCGDKVGLQVPATHWHYILLDVA